MPCFGDMFCGNVDRKIRKGEMANAIRFAIASELEAVNKYRAIAMASENEMLAKALNEIADEEMTHVGELMEILFTLEKHAHGLIEEGMEEMKEELGGGKPIHTHTGTKKVMEAPVMESNPY